MNNVVVQKMNKITYHQLLVNNMKKQKGTWIISKSGNKKPVKHFYKGIIFN